MKSIIITVALMTAVLTGCGGSSDGTTAAKSPAREWSKDYADTTCTDWTDKMTQAQNQTAAADMLGVAWTGDGESDRHPSKTLVAQFKSAITAECAADPTLGMTRAAATAYIADKATFKP